jgi:hypothetical protein
MEKSSKIEGFLICRYILICRDIAASNIACHNRNYFGPNGKLRCVQAILTFMDSSRVKIDNRNRK